MSVNGTVLAQVACPNGPLVANPTGEFDVGGLYEGTGSVSNPFNGRIDEVRLRQTAAQRYTLPLVGGTHTEWGQSSCASGASAIYTGTAAALFGYYGEGVSSPLCLDNNTNIAGTSMQPWGSGVVSRIKAGNNADYVNTQTVTCALCPGKQMIDWGVMTCPAGWNLAYAGHLANFSTSWSGGWSSGGAFCLNDTGYAWSNLGASVMLWRADQNDGNRGSYLSGGGQPVPCALCYQ